MTNNVNKTTIIKQFLTGQIDQQQAMSHLGCTNEEQFAALLAEHEKAQKAAEKNQPSAVNIAEFFDND